MMKTWNDAIAVLKNKRDALYLSGYIEKKEKQYKNGKKDARERIRILFNVKLYI